VGVTRILASLEGLDVLLFAEDEAPLASRIRLSGRVLGADRVVIDIHSIREFRQVEQFPLTGLDVRLLGALLTPGRQFFRSVAAQLGVAPRTLEQLFTRLSWEGVVSVLPGGDGHADFVGMVLAASQFELSGRTAVRRGDVAELRVSSPTT